jgi:hypothetical protein
MTIVYGARAPRELARKEHAGKRASRAFSVYATERVKSEQEN